MKYEKIYLASGGLVCMILLIIPAGTAQEFPLIDLEQDNVVEWMMMLLDDVDTNCTCTGGVGGGNTTEEMQVAVNSTEGWVNITGDTMTGNLIVNSNITTTNNLIAPTIITGYIRDDVSEVLALVIADDLVASYLQFIPGQTSGINLGNILYPWDDAYIGNLYAGWVNFSTGNTSAEMITAVDGQVNSTSWNRTGTNVFLANTGDNVGIGVTPTTKLQVAGSALFLDASDDIELRVDSTNDHSYIKIDSATTKIANIGWYSGGTMKWELGRWQNVEDLSFRNATGDIIMHFDLADSYVGIGTGNPTYTLEVAGTMGIDEYLYHNDDTDTFIRYLTDAIYMYSGGKRNIVLGPTANTFNLDQHDINHQVFTTGGVAFRVDGGTDDVYVYNNLGVGSSMIPKADLHIAGGNFYTTPTNVGASIALGYSTVGTYPQWIATRHRSATSADNAIDFYTGTGVSGGTFPTNAKHGMSIIDGKVGIATLYPQQELNVIGDTNVTGDSYVGDDEIIEDDLSIGQGGASDYAKVGGVIFTNVTRVTVPLTLAETLMHTYTIPANTLGTDGDYLDVHMSGKVDVTASEDIDVRIYFGGTLILTIGTGGNDPEVFDWSADFKIFRQGASDQYIIGSYREDENIGYLKLFQDDTAIDSTAAIVINVTGDMTDNTDTVYQEATTISWHPNNT